MLSLLSFPPEANCCWSKDHFSPQTYCLCPIILFMHSWLLKSRTRIFLSREPLARILFEFQPRAPTLAVWPVYVCTIDCLIQSQICTYPECVPTPNIFDVGLKFVLVIISSELSSTNRTTFELPAFQRYTLLLNPTANKLELDQSIKLR
jgi:hypothetical protein